MSERQPNAKSIELFVQLLSEQWASCIQEADETTRRMLCGSDNDLDTKAWRRQWFDVLSQQSDVYLRTPSFLQAMSAHLEALAQAKTQSDNSRDLVAALAGQVTNLDRAMRSQLEQFNRRLAESESKTSSATASNGWERFLGQLRRSPTTSRRTPFATPHEVVYEEGTLQLLRYANSSVEFAEPILICYALVNRPYILDLQRDRSVVRQLLDRGFDVYLIDWGVPTDADRTLRLSDYVGGFIQNVADVVCKHACTPQLNLLGYCMGGTMATMFTALHQNRVRNLILMATPIDFSGDEGLLNLWARSDYFDVDGLIDAYGNCPGEFLQYCFQLMKPVQNFAEKYLTLGENLEDNAFLGNFLAMESWANDSIPIAGETFREYVKLLYQQNRLAKDELSLGDVPVKLAAITCPLLLLVADQDHLVPPSSTLALERLVRSEVVESHSMNVGHIGLAVSSKAHRVLWPEAANWIAEHSTRVDTNGA